MCTLLTCCMHTLYVLGYIIIIRIREYYIRCRSMHIHTRSRVHSIMHILYSCTSIRMIATPRIMHAYPCWSTFLTLLVQLVPRGPSGYHPLTHPFNLE